MYNVIIVLKLYSIKACQSPRDHEDTTLALLFIILTDSSLAHKVCVRQTPSTKIWWERGAVGSNLDA